MLTTRPWRPRRWSGDCLFPCIDGADTQTEPFKPGIYVPTFFQYPDKVLSFRKCFYRVVEVLVSFSAVGYGLSNSGSYKVTV